MPVIPALDQSMKAIAVASGATAGRDDRKVRSVLTIPPD
jgi:hypothetical protein